MARLADFSLRSASFEMTEVGFLDTLFDTLFEKIWIPARSMRE
jgi:hypothetical protein